MSHVIMATLASVKLLCEKTLSGLFKSPNRRQTQGIVIEQLQYIKIYFIGTLRKNQNGNVLRSYDRFAAVD